MTVRSIISFKKRPVGVRILNRAAIALKYRATILKNEAEEEAIAILKPMFDDMVSKLSFKNHVY